MNESKGKRVLQEKSKNKGRKYKISLSEVLVSMEGKNCRRERSFQR